MTDVATEYPKCVQKELDDIERQRVTVLGLIDVAARIEPIAEQFLESLNARIRINPFGDGLVVLNIYPESMRECAAVLRELAKAGFHPNRAAHSDGNNFCDYGDEGRNWPLTERAQLIAFFTSPNGTCRKVKTGTREVAVYKIVCEEEASRDD